MPDHPAPALPPLVINPLQLSAELHLLRMLSGGEPTTRAEALRRIQTRYPHYTALGTPDHPTQTAERTWAALIAAGWIRYLRQGPKHGHVITGQGEARVQILWRQQVILPYLKRVEHEHGQDAARAAAAQMKDLQG